MCDNSGRHDGIPTLVNLDGPDAGRLPTQSKKVIVVLVIRFLKWHGRAAAPRRTVNIGTLRILIVENFRQHLRLGILVALLRAPIHRFVLDPRSTDADTLHIRATLDAKCEERARAAQVSRDVFALWEHRPAGEPSRIRRARLGGVVH